MVVYYELQSSLDRGYLSDYKAKCAQLYADYGCNPLLIEAISPTNGGHDLECRLKGCNPLLIEAISPTPPITAASTLHPTCCNPLLIEAISPTRKYIVAASTEGEVAILS